jgi:hypothetical protein
MLKDKERTLSEGDKVIIYTSKLDTESIVIGENGEEFDLQKIVKANTDKNVEYHVLYYIAPESEERMNNYRNMYNRLIPLSINENSIDSQLSIDKRTGFDLIFYYRHFTSSVEAFFCVNYNVYPECPDIEECRNRCREMGKKNNNSHLLYKQIRDDLAVELYNNQLSKLVYGENANASLPTAKLTTPKDNWLWIGKCILIILFNYTIPIISSIITYMNNISLMSGIVLCFVMYFYFVIFFIRKDIFGLVSPNRFSIKKLLEDYRLILRRKMNKKEASFGNKDKDNTELERSVYVFSHDLSTEVLKDKSQKIVRKNIKNGIKYYEFFCSTQKNEGQILDRCNEFKRFLGNIHEENIHFIPLKKNEGEINIIPDLLGSISFHKGAAYHEEHSFFSLRGGTKEVIYFHMPRCMSREYYNYFKLKKEENFNQKEGSE